jgi:hypothetical protein
MSVEHATSLPQSATQICSSRAFQAATISVVLAAALLASGTPVAFSIVIVFLFAGPHNWLEARYMLSRMPARWGSLRPYFLLGMIGVPVLAAFAVAMPHLLNGMQADRQTWLLGTAAWNASFGAWIVALIVLRSKQKPKRDWSAAIPIGLMLIAVGVMWPFSWSLALVYLHPLVALWFLDREIQDRRPEWLPAYRRSLLCVPVILTLMWIKLASAPNLVGDDILSMQITNHAGAGLLEGISTHALVATHTFLEMLHYGVWVIAIPLIGIGRSPQRLEGIPLVRRSTHWRFVVATVLVVGAIAAVALWIGFAANYPLTRDIYFTVATLHVLAEIPFLLRLL